MAAEALLDKALAGVGRRSRACRPRAGEARIEEETAAWKASRPPDEVKAGRFRK